MIFNHTNVTGTVDLGGGVIPWIWVGSILKDDPQLMKVMLFSFNRMSS